MWVVSSVYLHTGSSVTFHHPCYCDDSLVGLRMSLRKFLKKITEWFSCSVLDVRHRSVSCSAIQCFNLKVLLNLWCCEKIKIALS